MKVYPWCGRYRPEEPESAAQQIQGGECDADEREGGQDPQSADNCEVRGKREEYVCDILSPHHCIVQL